MGYGRKRTHSRGRSVVRSKRNRSRSTTKSVPPKSRSRSVSHSIGKALSRRVRTGSWNGGVSKQVETDYSGGSLSYHKFIFGPRTYKRSGNMGAPIIYQTNSTQFWKSTALGQQIFCNSSPICTVAELEGCQLITSNANKAALAYTSGLNVTNNVIRPFITYVTSEWIIHNWTVKPVFIEIYDYVWKRDSDNPIYTTWNDLAAANANVLTGTAGYVATANTLPGYVPYDNPAFMQMVKICKRKKVFLQAGEMHIHRISAQYNKPWNPAYSIDTGNTQLRNWTAGVFVIAHAGMAAGATSGYDQGLVELATYQINRYHMRPVSATVPLLQQQTTVTAIAGAEEDIDEVVGQVVEAGVGFIAGKISL
jgi:hypothetical protein